MPTVAQLTIPAAALVWLAAQRLPSLLSAATNLSLVVLALYSGYWLVWHARRALFNGLVDPKGKCVLITGCDSGFGHMLAMQLAKEGYFVFAGCLDENSDGAKVIKNAENTLLLQMDVTKKDEISEALRAVECHLEGRELWAVVANAGVACLGYIEWQPISRVRSVFDVNTFGALSVSTAFLPLLKKSRGRLVIVTSLLGRMTMPEYLAYCMSKCACTSLADGLRQQYFNRGLRVCMVEPGAYRTALVNHSRMEEAFDRDLELLPDRVRKDVNQKVVAYFKHTADVLHSSFMRDELQEVVDAMKMAVQEKLPRASYRPGATVLGLVRWLHNIAPAELADEVMDAARRISTLVKRK
ncbi:retinol dehydrogenase 7 [Dermacentor silvarum]|uniref:retinol dehydrogenase 7 n=1 Tax=Dermacentor silvarum TaxID=543639 RepID=UPI00189AEB20|nr:retinol dehydrogenase 7 [Dermacentor silvarum]